MTRHRQTNGSERRRKAGRGDSGGKDARTIRYAVVGLGYIAQGAVLPAFEHAGKNSELVALVSDDPTKLRSLGRKYGVGSSRQYHYDQYDECLSSGEIDAVYIALPNSMHCEYTVRAARRGVHVLCEKPMAVTSEECEEMIAACRDHDVRLMIAYRLHFEASNMKAVEIAESGKLGELRVFNSLFTMSVKEGDIRLQREMGGGTLYDIGIYCINAAHYLFRDEPFEVFAASANNGEERFAEVDEMTSAVLRFPHERLATFISSFGASDIAAYHLIGTEGHIRVDPAYEYAEPMRHEVTVKGKKRTQEFPKRDQFAPELIYFSDCVLNGVVPEPSGEEGLIDVRIIEALYESAREGQPIRLEPMNRRERPSLAQQMARPPVSKLKLIHARPPSED